MTKIRNFSPQEDYYNYSKEYHLLVAVGIEAAFNNCCSSCLPESPWSQSIGGRRFLTMWNWGTDRKFEIHSAYLLSPRPDDHQRALEEEGELEEAAEDMAVLIHIVIATFPPKRYGWVEVGNWFPSRVPVLLLLPGRRLLLWSIYIRHVE